MPTEKEQPREIEFHTDPVFGTLIFMPKDLTLKELLEVMERPIQRIYNVELNPHLPEFRGRTNPRSHYYEGRTDNHTSPPNTAPGPGVTGEDG
jgi:hypothetical protein